MTCSYRLPLRKWITGTARMPLPFGLLISWDKVAHFNSLQSISTCREIWACIQGWVCVPKCFHVPNMLQCRHILRGTQCFPSVFWGSAQLCTQSWGDKSDQSWCMEVARMVHLGEQSLIFTVITEEGEFKIRPCCNIHFICCKEQLIVFCFPP